MHLGRRGRPAERDSGDSETRIHKVTFIQIGEVGETESLPKEHQS